MNDTDRPENERVAFCQNCGRSLSTEEVRKIGASVYCEPCLAAKIAAADASHSTAGSAGANAGGSYGFSGTSSGVNYDFRGSAPPPAPPRVSGEPNPGLAALLGFIPGVGAFYNGQYAKGVVHLVVFSILTTLADRNGIFGLFAAGWIFYQVIEAHHTARARRDGTPLPNPFGLNYIGERMGFGRAWPGSGPAASSGAATPPYTEAPIPPSAAGAAPGAEYVAPAAGYTPPAAVYANYTPPPSSWGGPSETYAGVPPIPPMPPGVPFSPVGGSRFPTGAIFLIGLGVLFLIGNSGVFRGFPIHRLIPFLLIGLGVWLFIRKLTELGGGLADDGTPAYRLRLFRAARGPVWIVLVGVLFLLDTFDILSWGRSWPLFIIVGGLMTFFERTAYSGTVPLQYGYPAPVQPVAPEPVAPTPASTVTSIVPTSSQDREGN